MLHERWQYFAADCFTRGEKSNFYISALLSWSIPGVGHAINFVAAEWRAIELFAVGIDCLFVSMESRAREL
jgi:hypothetical protein